jgi:hypothetical protein
VALVTRLTDGTAALTIQKDLNGESGWEPWINLGGSLPYGNPILFQEPGQNAPLDVFAVDKAGQLAVDQTKSGTSAIDQIALSENWTGWSTVGASPITLTGDPTPVHNWSDSTEVFVNSNGAPEHAYLDNGKWYWVSTLGATALSDTFGAGVAGTMSAMQWSDGQVEVFAQLTNGHLVHTCQASPTQWSGWSRLAGGLTGSPQALTTGSGAPEIIYFGQNRNPASTSLTPPVSSTFCSTATTP